MKKKIISIISAFAVSILLFAFPASAIDTPTTWDDLTEDAQAVGTAYANAFSSYLNGDFFGGALSFRDVPISYYKFVTDLGWCISPVDDVYYYLVDGELFVDDTLCHSSGGGSAIGIHGGGGGKRRVSSEDDVVSDKLFYQSIVTKNPSPITVGGRISILSSAFAGTSTNAWLNFYKEGTFTHYNYRELYMIPFCYYASTDKYYYSTTQYHFFQEHGEKDSDGLVPIYLSANTSSIFTPEDFGEATTFTSFPVSTYRWVRCRLDVSYCTPTLYFFNSYEPYLKAQTGSDWYWCYDKSSHTYLYDLADVSLHTYKDFRDCCYAIFNGDHDSDCGYLISDEPFIFTSSINFNNIPDTVIIYPSSGDIYIDDTADNKQGDTINNYIYNNYVFPDNPTDDSGNDDNSGSGGSGTTSGDITVSGRVEVGGDITISANPIDININVNSGSGSSSDLPPVDDFVEYLPEQSQTMTDYFSIFFSFLPVELLALLIAGVAVAILCRVLGR